MDGTRRNALMIIDPQNDFCDQRGALYVGGAAADTARLARHIERAGGGYTDIFVSLDSHDAMAVFHPRYWENSEKEHPAPFAAITAAEYESGRWKPAARANESAAARLFAAMARKRVDALTIWPEHCIVSTWGHQIADVLRQALAGWRDATGCAVRYVFKGENPYTDQFSVFEGVDDSWDDTRFNQRLFDALGAADTVTFAGEALSHCVEASIASYVGALGDTAQSVRLLADCSSPVAGFARRDSLDRLEMLGVALVTSE